MRPVSVRLGARIPSAVVRGLAVACALAPPAAADPAVARATPDPASRAPAATPTTPVIGGKDAAAGAWPDIAGILYPDGPIDDVRCTGTLVAPTVVLTAAHCYDARGQLPDAVLIGASSLADPDAGELIDIAGAAVFPDPEATHDLAVLVLAEPSRRRPRPIATGWARADIANGAAVALVGFGAVNRDGDEFIDELQEARSTITDFDCSRSDGCNPGARPAGELGAGGKGIDTCPGDSGGPLYLRTGYGDFLAGVTSRSYDHARFACSDGGIYVRPDKLIAWIEATAGVAIARGPEPAADPIAVVTGGGGETRIRVNDPASDDHGLAITAPPGAGLTARVRGDGLVRVCADPTAAPGDRAVTVAITDDDNHRRAVSLTIPIAVTAGAPTGPCSFDDFDLDGGCCDAGRGPGATLPLALGVLVLLLRRRR